MHMTLVLVDTTSTVMWLASMELRLDDWIGLVNCDYSQLCAKSGGDLVRWNAVIFRAKDFVAMVCDGVRLCYIS